MDGDRDHWIYDRISLLEMIQFYAATYFKLARLLARLEELSGRKAGGGKVPEATREWVKKLLDEARQHCVRSDLDVSLRGLDRFREAMKAEAVSEEEVNHHTSFVQQVIQDELGSMAIFQVPRDRVRYLSYQDGKWVQHFGTDVETNFPGTVLDIREAGDCLAGNLGTSCVLNLTRVVEIGLKAIAKDLGITLDLDRGWEPTLRTIRDRIKEKKDELGDRKAFYDDVVGHLYAIKNAWRNPAIHGAARYDYDPARAIWNAVEGFMRKLATKLKES